MLSILFSDDNRKLVSPKEGVSVSVLSVLSVSVFAFFLVPDWILGQNGHNSGINTSQKLHIIKFSKFQVHQLCLKSIYSVI